MEIAEQRENGKLVMRVSGRLDSSTSPRLEEQLTSVIQDGQTRIAINLEALEYISSAGLRVLLKTARNLKAAGGGLVLCCMRDYVREVFDLSGFASVIPITAQEAGAVARLG